MNLMTAYVEVTIDDKPVKTKLTDVKKAFKDSAKESEEAWKKTKNSMKSGWDGVASAMKKALAVGAIIKVTQEVMKEQDAIFLLGSIMRATGNYTRETMEDMLGFAKSLELATTHGYAENIQLMRLIQSYGVTAQQTKMATVYALGLADALGIGTDQAALYIARGLEGETYMLSRYIPALKTAKDEQEGLAIIQEFAARAFEISGAKANTASGALKQLWNAILDLVRAFGVAFLPIIEDASKALTDFAQNRVEGLRVFANKTAAYVIYAKDVFIDLIQFMKTDLPSGMNAGLRVGVEYVVGFARVVIKTFGNAGRMAADAFIAEIGMGLAKWLADAAKPEGIIGKIMMLSPAVSAGRVGMMKTAVEVARASKQLQGAEPDITGLGRDIENIASETAGYVSDILDEAGVDYAVSAETLRERLVNIKKQQSEEIIAIEQGTSDKIRDILQEIQDTPLFPVNVEAQKWVWDELIEMEAKLANIRRSGPQPFQTEEQITFQAKALMAAGDNAKTYAEYMERARRVWEGLEINERWGEIGRKMKDSISGAFEDILWNAKSFEEAMGGVAQAIIQEFIKIQFVQPVAQMMSQGLTSLGSKLHIPGIQAKVGHTGGRVGDLSSSRTVPASVFSNAPKFHGLQPGERAIIAQDDEYIGRGPMGGVTLNINAIDPTQGLGFIMKNREAIAAALGKGAALNSKIRRSS